MESAREVCGSVRGGGNDEIKTAVRRKEAAWKKVLTASDKRQKKDVWKGKEKRREEKH